MTGKVQLPTFEGALGDHESRIRSLEACPCTRPVVVASGTGASPLTVTILEAIPADVTIALIPVGSGSTITGVTDSKGNLWTDEGDGSWLGTIATPLDTSDTITVTYTGATLSVIIVRCKQPGVT